MPGHSAANGFQLEIEAIRITAEPDCVGLHKGQRRTTRRYYRPVTESDLLNPWRLASPAIPSPSKRHFAKIRISRNEVFSWQVGEIFARSYNSRVLRSVSELSEKKSMSVQVVTQLLVDWRNGNEAAFNQLMPIVYDELRRIAHRYLRREGSGHSLQTADLVNEAYLKLINQQDVDWQNRAHFYAVSANIMRHLLVDHARTRQRAKRGGQTILIAFNDETTAQSTPNSAKSIDLLALDQALNRLAEFDERKSRIVELRYFGGLSYEETAVVLGVSEITIKRDWLKARAWLYRAMGGGSPDDFPSMAES